MSGRAGAELDTLALAIMVGVLVVGFIAKTLTRAGNERFQEPELFAG